MTIDRHNGHTCLKSLVRWLGERQFNQVWLESGATLAGAFVAAGLVDELVLYQAPKLMGADSRSLLALPTMTEMAQVPTMTIIDVVQVGPDIRITARL